MSNLLLTGNTREGARAKLSHYGLAGYFEDGAFCEDGDDRPTIARRALELARACANGALAQILQQASSSDFAGVMRGK